MAQIVNCDTGWLCTLLKGYDCITFRQINVKCFICCCWLVLLQSSLIYLMSRARASKGSKESRQKLANTKQTNRQKCLMRVCVCVRCTRKNRND